jgi:hypothetical protein
MTGVVVETTEQLKAVHRGRSHPVVTIVGELANNLLISGVVRASEQDAPRAEVVKLNNPESSKLYPVVSMLQDLSRSNVLELVEDGQGKLIRIYPKPCHRREGN